MKDVGGAVLARCSPPFLGRERAAVNDERDDMMFITGGVFFFKKEKKTPLSL